MRVIYQVFCGYSTAWVACVPDSFALPARSISTPHALRFVVLSDRYTSTYINTGSPTPSISGITHFRSNAFASTILNIFCTLIDADVEQKMSEACIAFAKRFAWMVTVKRGRRQRSHGTRYVPAWLSLLVHLLGMLRTCRIWYQSRKELRSMART